MRTLPVLLLLLLVACTGPEEDAVVLADGAADALSQGALQLAGALDEQDDCGALAEADVLVAHARDGVQAGTVPPDVANEVEAVVSELTADLSCEPEEEEDTEEAEQEAEDPDEPDEEPGAPGDEDPPDGEEDERDGRGPGGEGPPGQADDTDRDSGPPDRADGQGRGNG